MINIVDKLPDGISMSKYFQDKVESRRKGKRNLKYICIVNNGRSFYIPITKEIWEAFDFDNKLEGESEDGTYWDAGKTEQALGIIVGSILLQVRDDILGGMAQEVIQEVHNRIDELMVRPLMKELDERASQRMDRLLANPEGHREDS